MTDEARYTEHLGLRGRERFLASVNALIHTRGAKGYCMEALARWVHPQMGSISPAESH